ncbi:hypothetical protein [Mastigocoleus sp. MO_188.B34]|nr:hypothetical protein [Mastigocoleus sp. MO_188.B34]
MSISKIGLKSVTLTIKQSQLLIQTSIKQLSEAQRGEYAKNPEKR